MFNSLSKLSLLLTFACFFMTLSCQKKAVLNFSETEISKETETLIEINIPKANGSNKTATTINNTLTNFACSILNIDSAKNKKETIEESIKAFNDAYVNFKKMIPAELTENLPRWEALIDGEVSYQSEILVSITMNGSITTGSPSSSLKFRFFNFDLSNGKSLTTEDLINNMDAFNGLVKKYFDKELLTTYTSLSNNSKDFKLPETIGFNEDGVIIVYDNFELGNFNKEVIEFTIPFTLVNQYLNY